MICPLGAAPALVLEAHRDERDPVFGYLGGQHEVPLVRLAWRSLHRRGSTAGRDIDGSARHRLDSLFDGPRQVGQLVAKEADILQRTPGVRRLHGRREEQQR